MPFAAALRAALALSCLWLAGALLAACPRDALLADADGQPYRVKRLAKADLRYRVGEDGWVRVAPYFQYRLEREDAQYLYVREYVVPETPGPAAPRAAAPGNAAAPGETAALAAVDRLVLAPFDDGLPRAGQWRHAFALADLDGDGRLDLVHGPPRKGGGGPRIFLGDGAGRWRAWSDLALPDAAYDYGAVDVADFDGDGHLDLALAAHLRGISVLLGDGRGGFRLGNAPRDFAAGDSERFTTRALLARDWDGDGRHDLLTLGEGPSRAGGGSLGWAIYLNRGAGVWRRQAAPAAARRGFGDALATGDFDGDGRLDLLSASLAMGDRDLVHFGPAARAATVAALPPQALVFSVASADFDGDAKDDLAMGHISQLDGAWHSFIDVFLSRPGDTWQRVTLRHLPSRAITYALAAGDADGDGRRDLAAADDGGSVRLFLGDGGGGFALEQSPELQPLGSGCRGYHLRLADLNGDGRDEILAAFASERSPLGGEPGCPGDGRLAAWSPRRRAAQP